MLCGYQRIETIIRFTFITAFLAVFQFIVTFILLFKDMDFSYLFPITDIPLKDLLKASHILGNYYGESLCFIAIIPFIHQKELNKTKKYFIYTVILSGIIITLSAIKNIAVLGDLNSIYKFTDYQSIRLIDVREILTRVEAITFLEIILGLFVQVCIPLYAITLCVSDLLNFKNYRQLAIPITFFMISIQFLSLNTSEADSSYYFLEIYPYYTIPFQFIIPTLSWFILFSKNKPNKKVNQN